MVLSSESIKRHLIEGKLVIEGFKESSFRPASYLLRLSDQILLMEQHDREIDTKSTDTKSFFKAIQIPIEGYILKPGDFILGASVESLSLPNSLCGELSQLSCYARVGLSINFSANYVAPTFGHNNPSSITFEIKNESCNDIRIYSRVNFCHIRFMQTDLDVTSSYNGIYSGHKEAKAADFSTKPAKG